MDIIHAHAKIKVKGQFAEKSGNKQTDTTDSITRLAHVVSKDDKWLVGSSVILRMSETEGMPDIRQMVTRI